MNFKINAVLCGVSTLGLFLVLPASAVQAQATSATQIYQEAKDGNSEFLQLLARYPNVINMSDERGDTAYCLALKAHDLQTQELLARYGANPADSCVERAKNVQKEEVSRTQTAQVRKERRFKDGKGSWENYDNSYLWWGLGALAVGGGIGALASGGGSSGHSSGGNSGGDTPGDDETGFRTGEYSKSNFLEGINAATAYAHIYSKDASGNLVSHQADSDEALKKVKVGVLDSGVYANSDLSGKIVETIDNNVYNTLGTVRGYITKTGVEVYIFQEGDKYYIGQFETIDGTVHPKSALDADENPRALSEKELGEIVASLGYSMSDFTVMNGGGGGNPGTELDEFNPIDTATWYDIAGTLSHGTHVAGIIAGNKNGDGSHGVAFENAQIVAGSWDMKNDIYGTVKKMVDGEVEVINNSWGKPGTSAEDAAILLSKDRDVVDAYVYAANHKVVWVQATGNDSKEDDRRNATIHTGLGNLDLSGYGYNGAGEHEVPYLAVAALDYSTHDSSATSGYIAEYSNKCGSASGYCLAAPGTDVLSTAGMKEGEVVMSGTSMATPVVSGSIALLMGYYPWLSAQNVAYILVNTANKNGAYADSEIYGQGALDLEAAITKPIGDLGLATSSSFSSVIPVQISKLSLSGTMQNKLAKALPKTVTAFDALNRPFEYNTENMVTTTHASNANLRNAVSRAAVGTAKKTVKEAGTGFAFTTSESLDRGGNMNLATAEVVSESNEGMARFYYAENSKFATADDVLVASSNPYLAMNQAYGAENMLKLSDTSRLKFALQTGENGLYERDYEQDNHSFNERSYAFSGEYSFNMTNYLELAATGGLLFENDALLGMNGTGGFGIKDSSTYYAGLRASLNLTPNLSLIAAYYRGYTQGADTTMLAISDLETESFMIAGEYKINPTDKVGISFSSPLSVVKGRASLLYATGRDTASDTVYMNKLTTSLTPEAKEYDLGLYYQGQPEESMGLMGKVQARFNADGEKGVTDYIGIVGMQKSF